MDNLVRLVRNQDPGCDHRQVFGPAPSHGQADALRPLECGIRDGAEGQDGYVVEGTDIVEEPQQQLDDDVAPDVQVELVFGPRRPHVEPSLAAGNEQADAQSDQHDRLDDALDDDHLDEGVVLAADASELLPQPGEIMPALDVGLGHRA